MSWRLMFQFAGVSFVLAACASDPASRRTAPIESRTGAAAVAPKPRPARAADPDWRPKTHAVRKGETLYSIALEYGLDYRELAQWNSLADANVIQLGQTLRLFADETPEPVVTVRPLAPKKPLARVLPPDTVIAYPKAIKLPYSESAVAELQRQLQAPAAVVQVPVAAPASESLPDPTTENKNKLEKVEAPSVVINPPNTTDKPQNESASDDEALEWVWPTQGKLLSGHSENGKKGYDIAGIKGQAIYSASVGKVVYSGTGLRGYGKLIIIKHNKTYLSAYAHNQKILVKEGDKVAKGQKIAEMGDTDSDRVKLHFEIRRFGRPVDPSKYMPAETKP